MIGDMEGTSLRLLDLEFDPHVRSMSVSGQRTVLDRRSWSVFAALAKRLGECVSKEELLRAAWPHQLVHENSLAKAISKLRRTISGSGLEIVAAYGVGYILREAARDQAPALENEEPVGPARSVAKSIRSRCSTSAVVVAALLVILSAVGITGAFAPAQRAVPIRTAPPLTHDAPNAVATILWVDDHPSNNRLEIAAFKQHRIAVHLAGSTEDALKLVAMNRYALLISDLGRGDDRLAGLRMIEAMQDRRMMVPVIIYTMRPKDRAGQEAQRRMVTAAGAIDLAVTPQEVRAKVLKRLAPSTEAQGEAAVGLGQAEHRTD
ncbi:winged helix-turn-helix domain-containing protein [Sphingomonas sp. BN140010]|uniref:Winged helix-turn-helix domain-containing protein n=1 Tax=Sphingomonas arvum TaxID=2992113 RepID=A0ABT3JHD3_9SPHN|nr:winged helix-turn-helix domain-containing protein [Sphingomonas sp. BN140010]MCW3798463.1 winged helix-turn-helix domain-containing protein [Sphingomonas sp. BN140010]